PVLRQAGGGVGDGRDRDVVEGCRDHRFDPPFSCIRCQCFWGLAGMSMSFTPNGLRASATAFISAAVDAMVPASPIPLTPSGLVGLGVTSDSVSNMGRSDAVGIR